MSGQKPCFLTANEPACGVRVKALQALQVIEGGTLCPDREPRQRVDAVVMLPPAEERERRD
jgi:hypothetical protein